MRTDYLQSAHQAGKLDLASDVPGFLSDLAGADVSNENQGAFAAIIRHLADAVLDHPDSGPSSPSPVFKPGSPAAEELIASDKILAELTPDKPGSNDVLLVRWAFSGSLDPLAELLRRLVHRDGSNVADSVGGDAVALVMEAAAADPAFAETLTANNFDLGKFRFGNHPVGSFSLPRPVQAAHSGATRRATSPPPPVKTTAPAAASIVEVIPRPSRPRPAAAGLAVADHAAGKVLIGGVSLSISDAVKARDAITTAVVELLRPAEGLQWVDDTADPQSSSTLIEWDGIRGKGLPESGGGLLQGAVIQVAARGPDPEAGKYIGRVYNKTGGFTEFATGADDINAAKFAIAERVRQTLAG